MSTVCPLSDQQLVAVAKAADDKIAKTIAHEMGISPNVAIQYLHMARLKSGVRTTTGLVAKALREGWIK